MNKEEIVKLFEELNTALKERGINGEIGVVGGAAMVLAYGSNRSTKDVDAVFDPSSIIRDEVKKVAIKYRLDDAWPNDAVKAYMPNNPQKNSLLNLSSLKVWVPEPEYMLAMKSISARFDSKDAEDIILLCQNLNLKKPREVFDIIEKYYPKMLFHQKRHFL